MMFCENLKLVISAYLKSDFGEDFMPEAYVRNFKVLLDTIATLQDPVEESRYLLRARSTRVLDLDFQLFEKLVEESEGKLFLLSCSHISRFAALIKNRAIFSIVREETITGTRSSDTSVVELFLSIIETTKLPCRIYEIAVEEKPPPPPPTPSQQPVALPPEAQVSVKPPEAPPPGSVVEKTAQPPVELPKHFIEALNKVLAEVADTYNCVIESSEILVKDNLLRVKVKLRRKGLFGKCHGKDFREYLQRELRVLLEYYGVEKNYVIEAEYPA